MKYIVADSSSPVQYQVCGNLISPDGFVHMRRTIDCFIFIVVQEGTLHITYNNRLYAVGKNQALIMFPGMEHYGHQASKGALSYYWVHFTFIPSSFRICLEKELYSYINPQDPDLQNALNLDHYVLPEYYSFTSHTRVTLLFVQMLDIAKRDKFQVTHRMHYSLSLLLLELTGEYIEQHHIVQPVFPANLAEIIEWIYANYQQSITAGSLANQFGYNPTYLSSIFKKHTGYSIIPYINRHRIAVSKNLLLNRGLKIYNIADMCGFGDEKHFMKLFKRYENITPTQYRIAFSQKKINSK